MPWPQASVKALTQEALEDLARKSSSPTRIILSSSRTRTCQQTWRPAPIHVLPRAILTDSGGYQVFSLSELRKMTDEGVRFRSIWTARSISSRPEKAARFSWRWVRTLPWFSMSASKTPAPREKAEAALKRTTDWARRARVYFQECARRNGNLSQWQFGIVQGATFADLRRESARQLVDLDFPGYAVGGLAVGEPHEITCEMTAEATTLLPKDRLRYLMGVGRPEQIADYVALGN